MGSAVRRSHHDRSRAMGRTLESMDIHSPTVPQQPLSKVAENLNELLDEKIVLEETLSKLAEILEMRGVGTTRTKTSF